MRCPVIPSLLLLACAATAQAQGVVSGRLGGGLAWSDTLAAYRLGPSGIRPGGAGLSMPVDAWSISVNLPFASPGSDGAALGGNTFRIGPSLSPALASRQTRSLADLGGITEGSMTAATAVRSFYSAGTGDLFWNLGAQVRVPSTPAERAFSSSRADYSLLAGLTQPLGEFSVGANVGYAFGNGQTPYGLRHAWSGAVDAMWKLSSASRVGLSYGINAPEFDESTNRSLGLSYAYTFASGLRAQANVRLGLNDGSGARSLGLTLSHSY